MRRLVPLLLEVNFTLNHARTSSKICTIHLLQLILEQLTHEITMKRH